MPPPPPPRRLPRYRAAPVPQPVLLAPAPRRRRARGACALVTFITILVLLALVWREEPWLRRGELGRGELASEQPRSVFDAADDALVFNELTITFSSDGYPPLESLNLYAWSAVVEPYRVTNIQVLGSDDAGLLVSNGTSLRWRISIMEESEWTVVLEQDTSYPTLRHVFDSVASSYRVEAAHLRLSDGVVLSRGSQEAMSKYVRREIHSLTDADRAAYLGAMYVMHTTSGEEGRARYGVGFTSYEELTVQHISNWHKVGCSPYHDGDVFFTSHAAFASVIETSLQSIHPAVAQPYWDYTYEGEIFGSEWYKSEMFSSRWFGAYSDVADGDGVDYIVRSGPLSFLPVVESSWGFDASAANGTKPSGERNSYGRVTDWENNSPLKLVARSRFVCGVETLSPLPTCDTVGNVLNADSLYDLNSQYSNYIHNFLHNQLGGAWQCPASPARLLAKYPANSVMHRAIQEIVLGADMIWGFSTAAGMLDCPAKCEESTPFEECTCHCPALTSARANAAAEGRPISADDVWHIIYDSYIALFISKLESLTTFLSVDSTTGRWTIDCGSDDCVEDFMLWLVEFSCAPGAQGPLASPFAAPNDPLFGPTHTTAAYYWHFKRLLRANGQFFDDRWTDDNNCWGHHWDDALPFRHVAGYTSEDGSITNAQLYELLWPQRAGLPYVYDSFSFGRCQEGWKAAGKLDSIFGRAQGSPNRR